MRLLLACALLILSASRAGAFGNRSAKEYLDSCAQGKDNDCNTIGYKLQHGVDVPKDEAKARQLGRKGRGGLLQ